MRSFKQNAAPGLALLLHGLPNLALRHAVAESHRLVHSNWPPAPIQEARHTLVSNLRTRRRAQWSFRICKFLSHSILFRCLIMVKNLCQHNTSSPRPGACCKIICGTCVLLPLPVSPSKQTTLAVPQITGITSKGRVMSIFLGNCQSTSQKRMGSQNGWPVRKIEL